MSRDHRSASETARACDESHQTGGFLRMRRSLVLATSIVLAGSACFDSACTLVGCSSGLRIDFDAPPTMPFRLEASSGYAGGRNFGHLAYQVDDIYETCQRLMDNGVTINRPPRDGRMAFIRTPDNISVELLQKGVALAPAEPWSSMPNNGEW